MRRQGPPGAAGADGIRRPDRDDMNQGQAALEIDDLAYSYGRGGFALEGIGLVVPPGSFTALLGPNGAGKTTLMSLLTRLFVPARGRLVIGGWDLRQRPFAALATMGVVFQQPTVDLDLSVEQNLHYAAALHGLPRREAKKRIAAELGRVGALDRRREAVRRLSGGFRRRVEIARALLHRPQLLVLDEPSVGLDIASRRDIVEQVHGLCRDEGIAVLWTTHLIDEIWQDDRVVVLDQGRVRAAGRVDEVLSEAGTADLGTAYHSLTRAEAA